MLILPPPFCGGALCDKIKEKLLCRRLGQVQSINQQKLISRWGIGKHSLQTKRIQYGVRKSFKISEKNLLRKNVYNLASFTI